MLNTNAQIINEAIETVEQEVCNAQGGLLAGQVLVHLPNGVKPNTVQQLVASWVQWDGVQNYTLISFYKAGEEHWVDAATTAYMLQYEVEEDCC